MNQTEAYEPRFTSPCSALPANELRDRDFVTNRARSSARNVPPCPICININSTGNQSQRRCILGRKRPVVHSNLGSFLAFPGTFFHAGLRKLGFVFQFSLFSRTLPLSGRCSVRSRVRRSRNEVETQPRRAWVANAPNVRGRRNHQRNTPFFKERPSPTLSLTDNHVNHNIVSQ
jgi:hypothetical protein